MASSYELEFPFSYGAYLIDPERRPQFEAVIAALREALPPTMPVLVKMRVLPSIDDTVAVAKAAVAAGAGLLTVHGRTRRQGGGARTTGDNGERLASWPHIAAVKKAVSVPVIANGNVPDATAAASAIDATGCDGVMSGCGLLRDPGLFESGGEHHSIDEVCTDRNGNAGGDDSGVDDHLWKYGVGLACEYLDLADKLGSHCTAVSKHLLWMLDHRGFKKRAPKLREQVANLRFDREKEASPLSGIISMLRDV